MFRLQYGKPLSKACLVLKSSETLPKYGKAKVNFLLEAMEVSSF